MLTESNINKTEKVTHGTYIWAKNSVHASLLIKTNINKTEVNKIKSRL
jgi:hypothetical protein